MMNIREALDEHSCSFSERYQQEALDAKREPEGRTFRYYGYSAAHPSLYRKMPVVLYAGKIAIW